jgi:hypothetical protein
MKTHLLQRKCACGGSSAPCKCPDKQEVQRSASSARTPETIPPIVHRVLASSGRPLDEATRQQFEPRFGVDFSAVRIHADGLAAESARAVNANAYTVGRDIVFSDGLYTPQTSVGGRLLAHELTHVVQQRGRAGSVPTEVSSEADSSEQQARQSEAGSSHEIVPATGTAVARQPKPKPDDPLMPRLDRKAFEKSLARMEAKQKLLAAIWDAIDIPDKNSFLVRDEIWRLVQERIREFANTRAATKKEIPAIVTDALDFAKEQARDYAIDQLIELVTEGSKWGGRLLGAFVGIFTSVTEFGRGDQPNYAKFGLELRRPQFIAAIDKAIKKVLGITEKPKSNQDFMNEIGADLRQSLAVPDKTAVKGSP